MTNNPKKIEGIEAFDLKIVERVPIQMKLKKADTFYLLTKQEKMGHMLDYHVDPEMEEKMKEEKNRLVEEAEKKGE
jgi:3,4-dihydroxy 2-butanone 4-phosphate synthase/GTP cyclohydrolase II